MISIYILEDELLLAEDLKSKLESLRYKIIGTGTSGEEAIGFMNKTTPDIALLDIDIEGEMDGIEVGSYLKKVLNIPVIYLTQFKDLQTFDKAKLVGPSSYLTKPVNIWDLVRAIELSITNASIAALPNNRGYLLERAFYLRSDQHTFEKVETEEILYLKASGAYTEIFTSQKVFLFSDNLSYFERRLLSPKLLRVHRSYIINIERVDRIEDMSLVINDVSIPIGKTYRKLLKEHFRMI
ncbi:MAG: LytTR family transcriptional regulator DNA-binding domain-containing protein [Cyclobacteriaceae bacterium]